MTWVVIALLALAALLLSKRPRKRRFSSPAAQDRQPPGSPARTHETHAPAHDSIADFMERERQRQLLAAAYLNTVEPIREAKRQGRLQDALRLSLQAIGATENESRITGGGVAPWYYEQAAIVYRKLGDRGGEIEVLRRFAAQLHAPGVKPPKLLERLRKLESDNPHAHSV